VCCVSNLLGSRVYQVAHPVPLSEEPRCFAASLPKAADTLFSRHVSSCEVTRAVGMWDTINTEFYGADSHFCHSAYVTWSHVELWSAHVSARVSHFCCCTHFVRRDLRVECSSEVVISCLHKNILFMSPATLKPIRLEYYLPRLPGAKSSHEDNVTWRYAFVPPDMTWAKVVTCAQVTWG